MLLPACGRQPLPFPTPAGRNDLVVLIQNGPLTYTTDEGGNIAGLEYDLIEAFARELGVGVRYLPAAPEEIRSRLDDGEAHFAAAWFSPAAGEDGATTPPFLHSMDIVVQNEASLPIDELADLKGRTVLVMPGSRQKDALRALQAEIPDLRVEEFKDGSVFDLLEAVEDSRVETAVVDSAMFEAAQHFTPLVQTALAIGDEHPVVWRFGRQGNSELLARAAAFIGKARGDGTLDRLQDRYFGHVRRLGPRDVARFLESTEFVLPKLRKFFQAAQTRTGLDWRLLAALAYQESLWDASATSPTGVRGIMMLTEETADRLGVSNRLDARESIDAGARYLAYLRDQLPATASEPDRTWLALAAYNLGLGSLNSGRTLARQMKADPDSWYDMKRILPLLAQPRYYERLKTGRARGGEAVILTENIRSYYDILSRFEPPYAPAPKLGEQSAEKAGKRAGPAREVKRRRSFPNRRHKAATPPGR